MCKISYYELFAKKLTNSLFVHACKHTHECMHARAHTRLLGMHALLALGEWISIGLNPAVPHAHAHWVTYNVTGHGAE